MTGVFWHDGKLVNSAGKEVNEHGELLVKAQPANASDQALADLRQQLSTANQKNGVQAQTIETLNGANSSLRAQAGTLSTSNFTLRGDLDQANITIGKLREEIEQAKTELHNRLTRIDSLEEQLTAPTPAEGTERSLPTDFQQEPAAAPADASTGAVSAEQGQEADEVGSPDSTDTRTNPQLRAALDAKGIKYDVKANKPVLQQLALQNGV